MVLLFSFKPVLLIWVVGWSALSLLAMLQFLSIPQTWADDDETLEFAGSKNYFKKGPAWASDRHLSVGTVQKKGFKKFLLKPIKQGIQKGFWSFY